MRSLRKILSVAVLAIGLSSHGLAAPRATESMGRAIDRVATQAVASGETPGLQVAVFQNGRPVLVKGYGSASLELKVPVSNDSVFRIGSVTKQFTAASILLLAEEGKLSLDDRLSKYYPGFPRAGDITLQQMLHHTSGIHSFTDVPDYPTFAMTARSTEQMIDYIAKLPKTQDFEPGTSYTYSNSGYLILGGVVEKVSGQSLAAFFKTRLFVPLGMAHSAYDDEAEIVPGRVQGYDGSGRGKFRNTTFTSMTVPAGAGAIRSTASDLAIWTRALFGGKVLKATSVAAMITPGRLNDGKLSSTAMPKPAFEYGYALAISKEEGHRKIAHGGAIQGFTSALSYYPDDHVTVVVLSNAIGKDVGVTKIAERIERNCRRIAAKP